MTQLASKAATMTPENVPGPHMDIQTLFPWLTAITPAAEPVRPKPKPAQPTPAPALPEAA